MIEEGWTKALRDRVTGRPIPAAMKCGSTMENVQGGFSQKHGESFDTSQHVKYRVPKNKGEYSENAR